MTTVMSMYVVAIVRKMMGALGIVAITIVIAILTIADIAIVTLYAGATETHLATERCIEIKIRSKGE